MGSFYVRPRNVTNKTVSIMGAEARHIVRVLRHGSGDTIRVVDGMGTEYEVELKEASSQFVEGRIVGKRKGQKEPQVEVTLAQSIPKGSRMDYLVEKATELGVHRVIPVVTARSQVLPDGNSKTKRWQRIALNAMKQSGRSLLPKVDEVTKLEKVLESMLGHNLTLIAWEGGGKKLRDVVRKGLKKVLMFVGPEGGFTSHEVNLMTQRGGVPVNLGGRVLRSETAGVALLTLLLYELGEL